MKIHDYNVQHPQLTHVQQKSDLPCAQKLYEELHSADFTIAHHYGFTDIKILDTTIVCVQYTTIYIHLQV